ncbi:MAG: hypothetical protein ACJ72F_04940 [Nitrososphaeraceae archaeon]
MIPLEVGCDLLLDVRMESLNSFISPLTTHPSPSGCIAPRGLLKPANKNNEYLQHIDDLS